MSRFGGLFKKGVFGRGAPLLPLTVDFSTVLVDGPLPAPLTGATWSVVSGKAINTPTPLGSNIITDGDMELLNLTNWSAAGAPSTREKSGTQVHGGAQSLHIIGNSGTGAQNFITAAAGGWYELSAWLHMVSGTSARAAWGFGFATNLDSAIAAMTEVRGSDWVATANPRANALTIGGAPGEMYGDDVAAQLISFATQIAYYNSGASLVTAKGEWIIPAFRQAGVDVCIDSASNPLNFVRGFYDRTKGKAYLFKYVAGVLTALINGTTVAYSAGAGVEVRHTAANTFQLWYNGSQVGADQTISDAGIISNTIHAAFSAGGACQLNRFLLS